MTVAIIDYGLGNVRSVANALEAVGSSAVISDDPTILEAASHLILPGVGAFGDGMKNLRERGLVPLLNRLVLEEKKPLLGICLGMQLLTEYGDEGGGNEGLGWVPARTVQFTQQKTHGHKIPHVGWNDMVQARENPLFSQGEGPKSFYFVHSYYVECADPTLAIGTCEYGEYFTAALQREHIFGVQFHPEKSHQPGLDLLKSFLAYRREAVPC